MNRFLHAFHENEVLRGAGGAPLLGLSRHRGAARRRDRIVGQRRIWRTSSPNPGESLLWLCPRSGTRSRLRSPPAVPFVSSHCQCSLQVYSHSDGAVQIARRFPQPFVLTRWPTRQRLWPAPAARLLDYANGPPRLPRLCTPAVRVVVTHRTQPRPSLSHSDGMGLPFLYHRAICAPTPSPGMLSSPMVARIRSCSTVSVFVALAVILFGSWSCDASMLCPTDCNSNCSDGTEGFDFPARVCDGTCVCFGRLKAAGTSFSFSISEDNDFAFVTRLPKYKELRISTTFSGNGNAPTINVQTKRVGTGFDTSVGVVFSGSAADRLILRSCDTNTAALFASEDANVITRIAVTGGGGILFWHCHHRDGSEIEGY